MSRTARLLFDSASAEVAPGIRAVAGSERSLLFLADDISIDLVIFESGDGLRVIHGQVLDSRAGGAGLRAHVSLDGEDAVVETDPFGQFALSTMAPLEAQCLRAESGRRMWTCHVPPRPAPESIR